jgi:glycosyltransferase involved in cell wall biosynthesis
MSTIVDICLITPGHLASTPRLVKSADALAEAGFKVHVVAAAPFPPADRLDAEILATSKWSYSRINTRTGPAVLARKVARRLARRMSGAMKFSSVKIAAMVHYAESGHLAALASRVPAQLFIGHCIPGLYAAAAASRNRRCRYGFDIEDYHDAETDEAIADPVERRARERIQASLLPACASLTCAAPLIGEKYREVYKVDPVTILNVFPLSQAPAGPTPGRPITEEKPAIFYWFSQTIGHGRGLESVLKVMARMRMPVELHLRGFASDEYAASLHSLARKEGLKRPIIFLPPGSPNEMARLAAAADVGLSVEEGNPLNHNICLPNKIFVYLLAGIPQLLSNTKAQQAFAAEIPEAAILGDMARPEETASRLDSFLSNQDRVTRARSFAMDIARRRFSWDVEKERLVRIVAALLPSSR